MANTKNTTKTTTKKETVPAKTTSAKTTTAKTTSKKETSPAKPAPTKVAPVETAPVETAPVETTGSTVIEQFGVFMLKLQGVNSQMSALRTEFRSLERQVARELKAAAKSQAKRKRKSGNRAPSGFVKPTLISKELAEFLGKTHGTEMARTEVTREINAYIRANSLQDKDNGRKIIADKKLTGLLKLQKGDELTYFNLQKYMSPHFAKASDKATTSV
jgi:chromatin remodeling complex protein RSC6